MEKHRDILRNRLGDITNGMWIIYRKSDMFCKKITQNTQRMRQKRTLRETLDVWRQMHESGKRNKRTAIGTFKSWRNILRGVELHAAKNYGKISKKFDSMWKIYEKLRSKGLVSDVRL